jgi:hypothetical protein
MANKKVKWRYVHTLNHNSSVIRTKYGVYYGCVKHRHHNPKWDGIQLAIVKFDGNKGYSKVPFAELEFLD